MFLIVDCEGLQELSLSYIVLVRGTECSRIRNWEMSDCYQCKCNYGSGASSSFTSTPPVPRPHHHLYHPVRKLKTKSQINKWWQSKIEISRLYCLFMHLNQFLILDIDQKTIGLIWHMCIQTFGVVGGYADSHKFFNY